MDPRSDNPVLHAHGVIRNGGSEHDLPHSHTPPTKETRAAESGAATPRHDDHRKPPMVSKAIAFQRPSPVGIGNVAPPKRTGNQASVDQAWQKFRRLSRADFGETFRKHGLRKIHIHGLNYTELVHRFERQSTFHGISHAALAPNRKWRYIWYTAFFICLTALCVQIFVLLHRYFSHPKTVDLDLKFENAPFPSVTLCNLNPYKASAISRDSRTKATMDAFSSIVKTGGGDYGIAAAIDQARARAKGSKSSRTKRQQSNESKTRRYHQAYAQCICEVNTLSGERKKGSCFAAYKGNISIQFSATIQRFHPSRCICQLDWVSKTLWPCFPYNTWKERMCAECSTDLGHCPMRFYEGDQESSDVHDEMDVCLCHTEYNHCIANNENGYIMEIGPDTDISSLNMSASLPLDQKKISTTTTTTQAPEVRQALGFEGLKDEITIKTQAQQNLMFAVGELPYTNKVSLSQTKDELILKCSFNQKDCNITKDFKLHYDQTYGNCFTFNWNRTDPVTAHRAGANYGLRVLLFANVSEYLPTTEAVGFRITVHDKWSVPFPDAFGYSAPTGFLSSFGVRMKQFNRIPAPHGQCLDGGEESADFIYEGFNYSVEGCHRSCTQKEVTRICGCADPLYPIPKGQRPCKVSDPVARDCIRNTSQTIGQKIAEGSVADCVCHQPCVETNYAVTYSAARWPSGTSKVMECEVTDDLCMERYRKNAAMVQIFYEELNYETLSESPAYTLASAMADIGGLTGLWIGASVVSLLEIVALFVYASQAYYRKKKQAKYPKHSISSIANARPPSVKLSIQSIRRSTPSSGKLSKHSLLQEEAERQLEPLQDITSETESESSEETKSSRKSGSIYIPPGEDLPCDCIYDQFGKIKYMKALCPEHGYLVRRGTGVAFGDIDMTTLTDDDDGANTGEGGEAGPVGLPPLPTRKESRAAAAAAGGRPLRREPYAGSADNTRAVRREQYAQAKPKSVQSYA